MPSNLYKQGTISVTNGSNVVTGLGTNWLPTDIRQGDIFVIAGHAEIFFVDERETGGKIHLDRPYEGSNGSGLEYTILRMSGDWGSIRVLGLQVAEYVRQFNSDTLTQEALDEALANIEAALPQIQTTQFMETDGIPASGEGNVGDWAIDPDTGEVWKKTSVSVWSLKGNFKGVSGATIHILTDDPNDAFGNDGDVALNSETSMLFEKNVGAWNEVGYFNMSTELAEQFKDAAEAANVAAQAAKVTAEAARDKAHLWAEQDEDVPVETGEFSAKHYAEKAAQSAIEAANAAGGGVFTFNGRDGTVVPEANDYNADQINDTSTTKKFTNAGEKAKLANIAITQPVDLDIVESQLAGVKTKTDHLTVTQAVNLDTLESDAAASKTKTDLLTVTAPTNLDSIRVRVAALDAAVILQGVWDASAGTFPGAGAAQAGESWIVSVGGTVNGIVFNNGDRVIAITDNASATVFAANWFKADYTDLVSSVAGKTGVVTLQFADITDQLTFSKIAGAAIASQAEAEAGTAADKLMTAQRTLQAIVRLAGLNGQEVVFTDDASITNAHKGKLVVANKGTAIALTLAAAASLGADYLAIVTNAGAGVLTVSIASAGTFSDGTTSKAVAQNSSLIIACNGTAIRALQFAGGSGGSGGAVSYANEEFSLTGQSSVTLTNLPIAKSMVWPVVGGIPQPQSAFSLLNNIVTFPAPIGTPSAPVPVDFVFVTGTPSVFLSERYISGLITGNNTVGPYSLGITDIPSANSVDIILGGTIRPKTEYSVNLATGQVTFAYTVPPTTQFEGRVTPAVGMGIVPTDGVGAAQIKASEAAAIKTKLGIGSSSRNDGLFGLELADIKGALLRIADGVCDAFESETYIFSGTTPTTSYANTLGTGDRTATITVTQSPTIYGNGTPSNLVDGGFANDSNDTINNSGAPTANDGNYFQFAFGSLRYVDEIKLYANGSGSHGSWKWQYSTDGFSFVDLNTFTWTVTGAAVAIPVTGLPASGCTHLRLTKIGSTTLINGYFQEVEFKIAVGAADGAQNTTYNSTTDLFSPTGGAPTPVNLSGGTILSNFDIRTTAAFDGTTSQAASVATTENNNPAVSAYIGKTLAAPSKIASAIVYGSNDIGFGGTVSASLTSMTLTLYGKNGTAPVNGTDGTVLGSVTFTNTANESAGRTITSSDQSTTWDHVWVDLTQAQNINLHLAELTLAAPAVRNNMTLISTAFTAAAQPTKAKVGVQFTDNETITLNTDLKAWASRDNGTTWTQVTLLPVISSGTVKYWEGEADISGQPAGTSMRWKVTTHNNKNVDVSGVAIQWSTL